MSKELIVSHIDFNQEVKDLKDYFMMKKLLIHEIIGICEVVKLEAIESSRKKGIFR